MLPVAVVFDVLPVAVVFDVLTPMMQRAHTCAHQNASSRVPNNNNNVLSLFVCSFRSQKLSTEVVLTVVYQPLAMFRVLPLTRCSDSMPGHSEAVLHVSFSPDGNTLASGGGDGTVRYTHTRGYFSLHRLSQ
jgi:ribosome assembly protein 4